MARKPWEIPIEYRDERFDDPPATSKDRVAEPPDEDDARDSRDVEELLSRGEPEERKYDCNDTTPVDYGKGPHDKEFGVDEKDFDAPDDAPVPYENGEHDDEYGFDEEDV
jgi:hypothetical protein